MVATALNSLAVSQLVIPLLIPGTSSERVCPFHEFEFELEFRVEVEFELEFRVRVKISSLSCSRLAPLVCLRLVPILFACG